MAKFRLITGFHVVKDGYNETIKINTDKVYRPGDIIETDSDLERQFGAEKFQRVYDHIPGPAGVPAELPPAMPPIGEPDKRRK